MASNTTGVGGGVGGCFSFPGLEVAQASRTFYPCNDQLVSLRHSFNDIRGDTISGVPLPLLRKKSII